VAGDVIWRGGIWEPLRRNSSTTAFRWSAAAVREPNRRPETMSSTPVKGCDGSNWGSGVSDLSSDSGNGS